MRKRKWKTLSIALAAVMACSAAGCGKAETKESAGFTPRLDTEEPVNLEIAGFMGNFEALDQVINNFNEYYPNVTVSYEQNDSYMLASYVENNQGVDIIMTNDSNINNAELPNNYVRDACLDLNKEDIDFSDIQPEALKYCSVDGALLRVPITMNPCGMAVNETLLEKEGLKVPTNYQEFLDVLEALKDKGYVPIQGSEIHVYAEMTINMFMNMLASDKELLPALTSGEEGAADKIKPVFEVLQTVMENGYTDYDLNSTYGSDNYDSSIMSFFEGNMPFWICNAESFSGAKKRESKSETFSANPFTYEYMYVPLGEEGVYEYTEPWYGFSVCKNSDAKDYAVEFIRFLMTKEQSNTMASIKGMPSVAKEGTDERYPALHDIKNSQAAFSNDGTVSNHVREIFTQVCNDYAAGKYSSAGEAAQAFAQAMAQ